MPTPAERQAILFVVLVGALGAVVRLSRASAGELPPDPAATRELASQRAAVDRAIQAQGARDSVRSTTRARTRERPGTHPQPDRVAGRRGRGRAPLDAPRLTAPGNAPTFSLSSRVDLDRADAGEIERLPRIGASLARRIVADRDSFGPFGGTVALSEVSGVGPSLIAHLEGLVTFSGAPRPPRSRAAKSPRRR